MVEFVFVYPPITTLVSEYHITEVILSDLVEPEIPAYAFWYVIDASKPFDAWVYLTK